MSIAYFSVSTVKKKLCTTAVGIHLTAASSVNKSIGTKNIRKFVDENVELVMPLTVTLHYSQIIREEW